MINQVISVVIPSFNEADTILFTLDRVINYFKKRNYKFEIGVVDDGSDDGMAEIVKKANLENVRIVRHEINLGKGAAVRTGMINAYGYLKMFLDADYQISIYNLDNFFPFF